MLIYQRVSTAVLNTRGNELEVYIPSESTLLARRRPYSTYSTLRLLGTFVCTERFLVSVDMNLWLRRVLVNDDPNNRCEFVVYPWTYILQLETSRSLVGQSNKRIQLALKRYAIPSFFYVRVQFLPFSSTFIAITVATSLIHFNPSPPTGTWQLNVSFKGL
jgi:hypothetical protein